jgi:hypothetical protein
MSGTDHFEAEDASDAFVIDILCNETVFDVPKIKRWVVGQVLKVDTPVAVQGAYEAVRSGDVTVLECRYTE